MTTSVWTHPQFDPVALALGPIAIHWYGLMYLLAFVGVLALGRIRLGSQAAGRPQFTPRDLDDVLLYGVLGVVLGGRLGGMAFHGGLLGVIAALAIFAWRRRVPFFTVADFIAPLVPFGLAAGRMGNFINGELWGRVADPTAIPWAMVFPQAGDGLARHPSQLYQMGLEGIGLFIILWWYSSRPRPLGAVSGMFLIGYGGFRFLAEFAREPDQFLGVLSLGLSMGQWLSIPMILLGLVIIRIVHQRVRVD